MNRSSGVLLHISSLNGPFGIGTLGKEAYAFADFLHAAGQSYWQILPLGQTGYGDSPYQSFSTFAGNPYFIDLGLLEEEGLLLPGESQAWGWGENQERVDYGLLFSKRWPVLHLAYERGRHRLASEAQAFYRENADWLDDFALYMAVKEHFNMRSWQDWPDDAIRLREPNALQSYRDKLAPQVDFLKFVQFLFFRQWQALKEYVNGLGIGIIGDIPIYISLDSADAWANPSQFLLDEKGYPTHVAGVPPDYFSATGQLWGNPLYDWTAMKKDGYAWWMNRIAAAGRLYDVLRIDHFRGLSAYWAVPFGKKTAEEGAWRKGPGKPFIKKLKETFPSLPIIAEDLGVMTDEVKELLRYSRFPGMRVLEFGFDSLSPSDYMPHRYPENCVAYTGTHDNDTAAGWSRLIGRDVIAYAKEYLGLSGEEGYNWGLIRGILGSPAVLAVFQMQDALDLDTWARMNTPSTTGTNWQWRMAPGAASPQLAEKLKRLAAMYERL